MTTNFFFNNFQASQEQQLLQDLVVESIKIYGNDVYYIPFTLRNKDEIYGEDPNKEYNEAFPIEMYIKSVDGFEGDGAFLSKFNLEIRDQITFSVANKVFNEEVGVNKDLSRPREGDLIFFPLTNRIFEIKYVNKYPTFLQLGSLPFYDLRCEMFEHSSEIFNTGIKEIDSIFAGTSLALDAYALLTEAKEELVDETYGLPIILEAYDIDKQTVADNDEIQTASDDIIDFTEFDPFSEGRY